MKDFYIDEYRMFLSDYSNQLWRKELRDIAINKFQTRGFPASSEEAWHYTPLSFLKEQKYNRELSANFENITWPLLSEYYLCFYNGRLIKKNMPGHMHVHSLEKGYQIDPLLPTDLAKNNDTFVLLNVAFATQGYVIEVEPNCVINKPVHIVFYNDMHHKILYLENILNVGENSEATIIEHHIGAQNRKYFTNSIMKGNIKNNAKLDFYRIIEESKLSSHLENININQKTNSLLNMATFSLNGKVIRSDVTTILAENATSNLRGLFFATHDSHHEHHTTIVHNQPKAKSFELYKGIICDHARGVFDGKIYVAPQANHTQAKQINNNLILSDNAEIDTKPHLEIFTDDVQCTHGATVGKLDDKALFYLQTRGLNHSQAQKMLLVGFVNELLDAIQHVSTKAYLLKVFEAKIEDFVS